MRMHVDEAGRRDVSTRIDQTAGRNPVRVSGRTDQREAIATNANRCIVDDWHLRIGG